MRRAKPSGAEPLTDSGSEGERPDGANKTKPPSRSTDKPGVGKHEGEPSVTPEDNEQDQPDVDEKGKKKLGSRPDKKKQPHHVKSDSSSSGSPSSGEELGALSDGCIDPVEQGEVPMQMREPRSVDPAFAGKPNLKYPASSTAGRPTKPQVSQEWYSFKIIHRRNVSSFELHGLYLDFIWTLL